jgi:small subunit ribosomal protein S1
VLNEYRQGDVLEGKVTKVVAFGAFIEIVPGVEGLVHISELAEHHVETPGEVVTPGEEKWVRILEIDEERRRISLSIKRAETKNNAFSDLIPDELKQQVQAASDDAAAAEAADAAPDDASAETPEATEPVTEAATEAPADEVPDLGLSEDVFAEAPVEPAPEEAPPTDADEG